jgi:hypothetical protein
MQHFDESFCILTSLGSLVIDSIFVAGEVRQDFVSDD